MKKTNKTANDSIPNLFLSALGCLILAGCAPTVRVKEMPQTLALCPIYASDEDSLVIRTFDRNIADLAQRDSAFLRADACDTAPARLNVHFEKTSIPDAGDRALRYSVSALGIALPFILLAAEAPIFMGFIWFPVNRTDIRYELVGVAAEKNQVHGVSYTKSFFGSREKHVSKQGGEVVKNIERQVKAVKAAK